MVTKESVISALYVSLFGRSAEGDGLQYWKRVGEENKWNHSYVADQMLHAPETNKFFGNHLDSNKDFIDHIYDTTLAKTAGVDEEGKKFWASRLDDNVSRAGVVTELLKTALDPIWLSHPDEVTVNAHIQLVNRVIGSNIMAELVQHLPEGDLQEILNHFQEINRKITAHTKLNELKELISEKKDVLDVNLDNFEEIARNNTPSKIVAEALSLDMNKLKENYKPLEEKLGFNAPKESLEDQKPKPEIKDETPKENNTEKDESPQSNIGGGNSNSGSSQNQGGGNNQSPQVEPNFTKTDGFIQKDGIKITLKENIAIYEVEGKNGFYKDAKGDIPLIANGEKLTITQITKGDETLNLLNLEIDGDKLSKILDKTLDPNELLRDGDSLQVGEKTYVLGVDGVKKINIDDLSYEVKEGKVLTLDNAKLLTKESILNKEYPAGYSPLGDKISISHYNMTLNNEGKISSISKDVLNGFNGDDIRTLDKFIDIVADQVLSSISLTKDEIWSLNEKNLLNTIKDGEITIDGVLDEDSFVELTGIEDELAPKLKEQGITGLDISFGNLISNADSTLLNNLKDKSLTVNNEALELNEWASEGIDFLVNKKEKIVDNSIAKAVVESTEADKLNIIKSLLKNNAVTLSDANNVDGNILDDLVLLGDKLSSNAIEGISLEYTRDFGDGEKRIIKDGAVTLTGITALDNTTLSEIDNKFGNKIKEKTLENITLTQDEFKNLSTDLITKIKDSSVTILPESVEYETLNIAGNKLPLIKDNSLKITNTTAINDDMLTNMSANETLLNKLKADALENLTLSKAKLTEWVDNQELSYKIKDGSVTLLSTERVNLTELGHLKDKLADGSISGLTLSLNELNSIPVDIASKLTNKSVIVDDNTLDLSSATNHLDILNSKKSILKDGSIEGISISSTEIVRLEPIKDLIAQNSITLSDKLSIPSSNLSAILAMGNKIANNAIEGISLEHSFDFSNQELGRIIKDGAITLTNTPAFNNDNLTETANKFGDKIKNKSLQNVTLSHDEFSNLRDNIASKIKDGEITLTPESVEYDLLKNAGDKLALIKDDSLKIANNNPITDEILTEIENNATLLEKLKTQSLDNLTLSKNKLAEWVNNPDLADKIKAGGVTLLDTESVNLTELNSLGSKLANSSISTLELSIDDLATISDETLNKLADGAISLNGPIVDKSHLTTISDPRIKDKIKANSVELDESIVIDNTNEISGIIDKLANGTIKSITLDKAGLTNSALLPKIADGGIVLSGAVTLNQQEYEAIKNKMDKLKDDAIGHLKINLESLLAIDDFSKIRDGAIELTDSSVSLSTLKDFNHIDKLKDQSIKKIEVGLDDLTNGIPPEISGKIKPGGMALDPNIVFTPEVLRQLENNLDAIPDNTIADITISANDFGILRPESLNKFRDNSISFNDDLIDFNKIKQLIPFKEKIKDSTIYNAGKMTAAQIKELVDADIFFDKVAPRSVVLEDSGSQVSSLIEETGGVIASRLKNIETDNVVLNARNFLRMEKVLKENTHVSVHKFNRTIGNDNDKKLKIALNSKVDKIMLFESGVSDIEKGNDGLNVTIEEYSQISNKIVTYSRTIYSSDPYYYYGGKVHVKDTSENINSHQPVAFSNANTITFTDDNPTINIEALKGFAGTYANQWIGRSGGYSMLSGVSFSSNTTDVLYEGSAKDLTTVYRSFEGNYSGRSTDRPLIETLINTAKSSGKNFKFKIVGDKPLNFNDNALQTTIYSLSSETIKKMFSEGTSLYYGTDRMMANPSSPLGDNNTLQGIKEYILIGSRTSQINGFTKGEDKLVLHHNYTITLDGNHNENTPNSKFWKNKVYFLNKNIDGKNYTTNDFAELFGNSGHFSNTNYNNDYGISYIVINDDDTDKSEIYQVVTPDYADYFIKNHIRLLGTLDTRLDINDIHTDPSTLV